ncbi:MAG: hypothetical protein LKI25_02155 [Atopobiaceae bacterium]|jgi:hypothetical protein|nr:hypothetical protein [Atopobiaceae bacterium]
MYMLTMKNGQAEARALKKLLGSGYIADDCLPLVEIIRLDKHDPGPADGFSSCHETLGKIDGLMPGRKMLIDFFRGDLSRYKSINASKCGLVFRMNNSLDAYSDHLLAISNYKNLVPVIAVKEGVENLSPERLVELAFTIRKARPNWPLAIRVEKFEGYEDALRAVLTSDDYLIYDINETPLVSRVEELEELSSLGLPAEAILLCSPRRRDIKNGSYEDGCPIDNSHIVNYVAWGFDGVGDYAGLRDTLPGKGGARGCALALMYKGASNDFKAYVNPDSRQGTSGFRYVVGRLLADRSTLERFPGECLVLSTVADKAERGHFGAFPTWIEYTIERYVQQLYLAHGNSYVL